MCGRVKNQQPATRSDCLLRPANANHQRPTNGTPHATGWPGATDVVDYELNELKREFLDEAREKVAEMESAAERIREQVSLDRLAYLAHQLKGSGGSYGYQQISTDATGLEKLVESLAAGTDDTTEAPEQILQYVVALRDEIDRALAEL